MSDTLSADALQNLVIQLRAVIDAAKYPDDAVTSAIIELPDETRDSLYRELRAASIFIYRYAKHIGGPGPAGDLLGLAPDHDELMSVLHAIDPSVLSDSAIDTLLEDSVRLVKHFWNLPTRLSKVFEERIKRLKQAEETRME